MQYPFHRAPGGLPTPNLSHTITLRRVLFDKLTPLALALLLFGLLSLPWAAAQPALDQSPQSSSLHPNFSLLDETGASVVVTGNPVSTLTTCGACHDTAFIQEHSYHTTLGLDQFGQTSPTAGGQPWDSSPGAFGRWDPLRYRYLSLAGDPLLDLGTPAWVMEFGDRHVGGGPALTTRAGRPLTALPPDASNPESAVLDPAAGQAVAWDWAASGGVEMNCFLCHLPNPNNAARIAALQQGQFRWANTATLVGTGLVEATGETYRWNADAFQPDGSLAVQALQVQDPTNANCGQCHGLVHTSAAAPVALTSASTTPWSTLTTGQIISGQRISASGLNLAGKAELTRVWDVHAARQLECTNCHFSLNNPIYFRESSATRPAHLDFDPRRLDFGEYLQRPLHDFATGAATQHAIAPELTDTMRRCESCHNPAATHEWLPYSQRHFDALACETCHIPQLYAPALQSIDWTALTTSGEPRREYRGVDGDPQSPASLIEGFEPALLPRQDVDGKTRLAPHNLLSAWYWVYGEPVRPVRLSDLQAAWLEGAAYAPAVLAALDADGNGDLSAAELTLDTPAKQSVIAGRLAALGLSNPRIAGDVRAYTISHNVTDGAWVTRDCGACHSAASRLAQTVTLASAGPSGVTPTLLASNGVVLNGALSSNDKGAWQYQVNPDSGDLYVFGWSRTPWVDRFGLLTFAGVLLAVALHGGLRVVAALRLPKQTHHLKRVYVYTVYQRFWHWLQTFTILGLIFSGLIIHKPELFGVFAFAAVVQVHNILAAIVVVNAALSLFYHLASGRIKQFVPRPGGFYDQAILQARFYLFGIFKNEPHPFEKMPTRQLNPLQQITYLGLLNILLPGQVITGALIWGAQRWPDLAQGVGGLPFLGPLHSLIAWLLAAFVVLHVYLTTTGSTPLALTQAMMMGWELVETHEPPAAADLDSSHQTAQEASTHDN